MADLPSNVRFSWQLISQFVSWEFCRYMSENNEANNSETDVLAFLRSKIFMIISFIDIYILFWADWLFIQSLEWFRKMYIKLIHNCDFRGIIFFKVLNLRYRNRFTYQLVLQFVWTYKCNNSSQDILVLRSTKIYCVVYLMYMHIYMTISDIDCLLIQLLEKLKIMNIKHGILNSFFPYIFYLISFS